MALHTFSIFSCNGVTPISTCYLINLEVVSHAEVNFVVDAVEVSAETRVSRELFSKGVA
jgi:hypothetical protein